MYRRFLLLKNLVNKNIKYLFCFVFLLFSFNLPIFSQSYKIGFDITHKKGKVTIPFELKSNLIIVNVLFQNSIPLKFVVDTGVKNTVLIDKVYSDILDIVPDRKMTLVGAAGGKEVEAFVASNVSIDLEHIEGENLSIMILKEDYIELDKTLGINVHGILGYDLFKNFVVEIDYYNEELTFYNPSEFKRPKSKKYHSVPITIEDTKPYINQTIYMHDSTAVAAKLMLDTGATHALMLHQTSDEKIVLPEKRIRDLLGKGVGGPIEGYVGRILAMELAEYCLCKIVTKYPDKGTYNDVIEETNRNGTIGGEVLKRYTVIFDYLKGEMLLRWNHTIKDEFDYDMSGLTVEAEGEYLVDQRFIIGKIRENSPAAETSIKRGDEIIFMNGRKKGDNLTLIYITNTLRSRENKKIKMRLKRGNQIIDTEFRLREII